MVRNAFLPVLGLVGAALLAACAGDAPPPREGEPPRREGVPAARSAPPAGKAPAEATAAPAPAEDRRITYAVEDELIWRVVARIAELAEANVTCDPEHVRGRVTVNFVDVPWRKALESLAHQSGCVLAEGPGGVVQVLSLDRSYGVEEPVKRR